MSKPKHLGVTPPISTNAPSEEEEALSTDLLNTLKDEGVFEGEDERKNREVVLGKIDKLVKEVVYQVALKNKLPESLARECGGKIFTYGSYRLGVHGAGADIDTLCVVPSHVKREDFFEYMTTLLKERSEVTELTAVPDAYVPVIKLQFSGVDIDMIVGVLQQPTIPDDLELLDDKILRSIDELSVRSVNGSRVTDEILRLVPNVSTFRLALRCIKLWAKRRAIYSNSVGFFGGVAWAMAVARICQLYPNQSASTIVARFFHIFLRWNWPMPIVLKPIDEGSGQFGVWNPKFNQSDRNHKMPIITPAYPSMCATHNVSQSTKQVIYVEIKRGVQIIDKIMKRELPWKHLFEKDEYFRQYKFYLQVNVSSRGDEEHHRLHGFVESRLRFYVASLETSGQFVLIHPCTKSFEHEFACKSDEEAQRIRAGFLPAEPSTPAPEGEAAPGSGAEATVPDAANGQDASSAEAGDPATGSDSDKGKIHTSTFYLGLHLIKRERSATGERRMDLSLPTQDFIRRIKDSDVWKGDDEMAISIRFLRQEQLPDEVFAGMSRERLRTSSSTRQDKKKSKKRSTQGADDAAASEAPAKKAKLAAAPVPSTSGFAADAGSKQASDEAAGRNMVTSAEGGSSATANGSTKPATSVVSIPAPVPPMAKSGGIKLKLLGS
ncbi:polynucleotide adenylyltransferase [Coemansia sp. RSA 2705]|nr:polynucleotide adenylyltransferase [Coemansia sp. RSA 2705]